jgi:hypothetical protein
LGWDLAEWSERCASVPKITGSNPSCGSELTFCSDLLLTARGGSTRALNEFASLKSYPGNREKRKDSAQAFAKEKKKKPKSYPKRRI